MEFGLLRVLIFFNALYIGAVNLVTSASYRFEVYSVNKCPMSKNEFQTAAKRRNCTGSSRYLCAPNKYLSSLIEFCTDRHRSLYGQGNCVKLEGTGDLNHHRCKETFITGCPQTPYYDDEIYKYIFLLQALISTFLKKNIPGIFL